MTYTLSQADAFVLTPNIYDENYVDFLLAYCKKEKITCIIPLFDIDLPILAKNKDKFYSNGIFVLVSETNVVSICNDKWATYEFLLNNGINQPKSFITLENVSEALSNKEIQFPLIIKPRWGMGSIGIYQIDNMEDLHFFHRKLKKQIFETYLKYESLEDQKACIIIQEKILGDEYGIDVFNDFNGKNASIIAKKKNAMRAGETDIATIIDDTRLYEIGKKLSLSLKHIGNLDVDCFISKDNSVLVLEMNCRFGGQYPFSHIAGANFPKQIVEWLNGKKNQSELLSAKSGTVGYKEIFPVKI